MRTITTVTCGALGTLAAFLNLLDHFLAFLFYLSIVFVPVASIIVIDFFWLRSRDYLEGDGQSRRIEWTALAAWAVGAGIALLGSAGLAHLTGVAALDALLVTALLYALLRWRSRSYRAAPSRADV